MGSGLFRRFFAASFRLFRGLASGFAATKNTKGNLEIPETRCFLLQMAGLCCETRVTPMYFMLFYKDH